MNSLIVTIAISALLLIEVNGLCYKKSYGRGVGTPLSTCDSGLVKDGGLCYDKCSTSGYTALGPICWEDCRSGYENHGATCFRNAHIYGKGCCCSAFDKGCCALDKCENGYTDDGCTCRKNVEIYFKKSFGRGVGVPLICESSEEQSGALCYPVCDSDFVGVGPVCWQSECVGKNSYSCGSVFCAESERKCYSELAALVASSVGFAVSGLTLTGGLDIALIAALAGIGGGAVGLTSGLILDVCNTTETYKLNV